MADVLNSGGLSPCQEFRIGERNALAAEHELDFGKFTMQEAGRLHEISMVFDRVFASNQADNGRRLRNAQRFTNLGALSGIGSETMQVKTIENDLHSICCITELRVELPRGFRAANDSPGQLPRQAGAHPTSPDGGTLIGFRMQFAVTDIPNNAGTPRKSCRKSADQVLSLIHISVFHSVT